MSLVLFYTRRVREGLRAPTGIAADAVVLLFAGSIVGVLIMMGRQASAPLTEKTVISLSLWALPKYTLLSLGRGFAAYILSLVFTLIYGTVAAHNRRAEKIMVPALDVLQSIPVLSFLPSLVLAMIALFPTREIGLEIACIVMIFTAQAWNMTFSLYGSIKSIPMPLKEAAQVYRLGWWRVFRVLELPASMIGLVWNSMMSMAGGWFVLTISEAFTLRNKDFRLPGIGSYMGEAINQFDPHASATWQPIIGAVIAMVTMIVAVDQLFWRPIVAWSERFKMEETAETDKPQSWVLELFQNSRVYQWLARLMRPRRRSESLPVPSASIVARGLAVTNTVDGAAPLTSYNGDVAQSGPPGSGNGEIAAIGAGKLVTPSRTLEYGRQQSPAFPWLKPLGGWTVVVLLAGGSACGLWALIHLLAALPLHGAAGGQDWLHVTGALGASFLRTSAAILIGAAWTLPAGILIGLSPKWSQRLQPVVQVVASFPAPMLFPLITLLLAYMHFPFTIGCIALMLLGTQWYILFNVIAGAMAIPGDLKEVQTVLGTGIFRRWTRLYIPCVFPFLVTGLVTAAGGAWNATIVSEYVKVNDKTYVAFGIGSIISEATDAGNFPLLATATVMLGLCVVLLNRAFWKRLYRVAEQRYSLNV
ncbi:MAG TPA: ABC transporter permease subunit [Tepidisphaeraceae bacterium]|nr:ABC transporter permease subunit [Tepidisphaeraceae bacterium]